MGFDSFFKIKYILVIFFPTTPQVLSDLLPIHPTLTFSKKAQDSKIMTKQNKRKKMQIKNETKQNPPKCNQIKVYTKQTMESIICLLITREHESCLGLIDI